MTRPRDTDCAVSIQSDQNNVQPTDFEGFEQSVGEQEAAHKQISAYQTLTLQYLKEKLTSTVLSSEEKKQIQWKVKQYSCMLRKQTKRLCMLNTTYELSEKENLQRWELNDFSDSSSHTFVNDHIQWLNMALKTLNYCGSGDSKFKLTSYFVYGNVVQAEISVNAIMFLKKNLNHQSTTSYLHQNLPSSMKKTVTKAMLKRLMMLSPLFHFDESRGVWKRLSGLQQKNDSKAMHNYIQWLGVLDIRKMWAYRGLQLQSSEIRALCVESILRNNPQMTVIEITRLISDYFFVPECKEIMSLVHQVLQSSKKFHCCEDQGMEEPLEKNFIRCKKTSLNSAENGSEVLNEFKENYQSFLTWTSEVLNFTEKSDDSVISSPYSSFSNSTCNLNVRDEKVSIHPQETVSQESVRYDTPPMVPVSCTSGDQKGKTSYCNIKKSMTNCIDKSGAWTTPSLYSSVANTGNYHIEKDKNDLDLSQESGLHENSRCNGPVMASVASTSGENKHKKTSNVAYEQTTPWKILVSTKSQKKINLNKSNRNLVDNSSIKDISLKNLATLYIYAEDTSSASDERSRKHVTSLHITSKKKNTDMRLMKNHCKIIDSLGPRSSLPSSQLKTNNNNVENCKEKVTDVATLQYDSTATGVAAAHSKSIAAGVTMSQCMSNEGVATAHYMSKLAGVATSHYKSKVAGVATAHYKSKVAGAATAHYKSKLAGVATSHYESKVAGVATAQFKSFTNSEKQAHLMKFEQRQSLESLREEYKDFSSQPKVMPPKNANYIPDYNLFPCESKVGLITNNNGKVPVCGNSENIRNKLSDKISSLLINTTNVTVTKKHTGILTPMNTVDSKNIMVHNSTRFSPTVTDSSHMHSHSASTMHVSMSHSPYVQNNMSSPNVQNNMSSSLPMKVANSDDIHKISEISPTFAVRYRKDTTAGTKYVNISHSPNEQVNTAPSMPTMAEESLNIHRNAGITPNVIFPDSANSENIRSKLNDNISSLLINTTNVTVTKKHTGILVPINRVDSKNKTVHNGTRLSPTVTDSSPMHSHRASTMHVSMSHSPYVQNNMSSPNVQNNISSSLPVKVENSDDIHKISETSQTFAKTYRRDNFASTKYVNISHSPNEQVNTVSSMPAMAEESLNIHRNTGITPNVIFPDSANRKNDASSCVCVKMSHSDNVQSAASFLPVMATDSENIHKCTEISSTDTVPDLTDKQTNIAGTMPVTMSHLPSQQRKVPVLLLFPVMPPESKYTVKSNEISPSVSVSVSADRQSNTESSSFFNISLIPNLQNDLPILVFNPMMTTDPNCVNISNEISPAVSVPDSTDRQNSIAGTLCENMSHIPNIQKNVVSFDPEITADSQNIHSNTEIFPAASVPDSTEKQNNITDNVCVNMSHIPHVQNIISSLPIMAEDSEYVHKSTGTSPTVTVPNLTDTQENIGGTVYVNVAHSPQMQMNLISSLPVMAEESVNIHKSAGISPNVIITNSADKQNNITSSKCMKVSHSGNVQSIVSSLPVMTTNSKNTYVVHNNFPSSCDVKENICTAASVGEKDSTDTQENSCSAILAEETSKKKSYLTNIEDAEDILKNPCIFPCAAEGHDSQRYETNSMITPKTVLNSRITYDSIGINVIDSSNLDKNTGFISYESQIETMNNETSACSFTSDFEGLNGSESSSVILEITENCFKNKSIHQDHTYAKNIKENTSISAQPASHVYPNSILGNYLMNKDHTYGKIDAYEFLPINPTPTYSESNSRDFSCKKRKISSSYTCKLDCCTQIDSDKASKKKKRRMYNEKNYFENFEKFRLPMTLRWIRELVTRSTTSKAEYDVYYHPPVGKKLRSLNEIQRFLESNEVKDLSLDNFSFRKTLFGFGEPYEISRFAKHKYPTDLTPSQPVVNRYIRRRKYRGRAPIPSDEVMPASMFPEDGYWVTSFYDLHNKMGTDDVEIVNEAGEVTGYEEWINIQSHSKKTTNKIQNIVDCGTSKTLTCVQNGKDLMDVNPMIISNAESDGESTISFMDFEDMNVDMEVINNIREGTKLQTDIVSNVAFNEFESNQRKATEENQRIKQMNQESCSGNNSQMGLTCEDGEIKHNNTNLINLKDATILSREKDLILESPNYLRNQLSISSVEESCESPYESIPVTVNMTETMTNKNGKKRTCSNLKPLHRVFTRPVIQSIVNKSFPEKRHLTYNKMLESSLNESDDTSIKSNPINNSVDILNSSNKEIHNKMNNISSITRHSDNYMTLPQQEHSVDLNDINQSRDTSARVFDTPTGYDKLPRTTCAVMNSVNKEYEDDDKKNKVAVPILQGDLQNTTICSKYNMDETYSTTHNKISVNNPGKINIVKTVTFRVRPDLQSNFPKNKMGKNILQNCSNSEKHNVSETEDGLISNQELESNLVVPNNLDSQHIVSANCCLPVCKHISLDKHDLCSLESEDYIPPIYFKAVKADPLVEPVKSCYKSSAENQLKYLNFVTSQKDVLAQEKCIAASLSQYGISENSRHLPVKIVSRQQETENEKQSITLYYDTTSVIPVDERPLSYSNINTIPLHYEPPPNGNFETLIMQNTISSKEHIDTISLHNKSITSDSRDVSCQTTQ
nr:uncharacterized protein LOC123767374 isoform X1 [Procambarus clarkii]